MYIIRKAVQILLFINSICLFSKELKILESEINILYDKFETKDIQFKNLKEITNLYEYSIKENIQIGVLRGLYCMQRHYLDQENYTLSLYYGQQAEDLALQINDYQTLGCIYTYMGEIFIKLGMKQEAQKFINLAKKYASKTHNKTDRDIQFSYIYMQLAILCSSKQNNRDSAIHYYQKALNILGDFSSNNTNELQKAKFFYLHIFNNLNIGNSYINYHAPPQIRQAEYYFHKTLNFASTNPKRFRNIAANVYYSVAHFYFVKKDYFQCIKYLEKTLEAEKRIKNPETRLLTYKKLKSSYDSLGNNNKRNIYLILYNKLNDSILSTKHKFDFSEPKEQYLSSLFIPKRNYHKNPLFISFATFLLLIGIIGTFLYKRKKNYHTLIDQLMQKNYSKNTQLVTSNIINKDITSEKEKEIIKKLKTFEISQKFLKKDVSLSYLSYQFSTNPKYLSLMINKHKEQNFNGYINKLRINYILNKLLNIPKYRKYKIVSLSEECGYASSQVFINAFKKETGVTPSYFISNLKNSPIE
ncbi:helix-turn-helix domain-containing protein [Elizabethkingia sp. HX XZB]|uniref:helix-turn-helix domain-containing protein n=1 Tax=Elizabethkingia sp. HX XZB TaxID=3003193 RepID=UPI002A24234B|nr:helix-turn-helix domain-containing protein [Elizabethkingia sp. HX XZB]MDX8569355.1 helix-turn-helix domain-containing protein [Elizabethkingia sp. HX XZB]